MSKTVYPVQVARTAGQLRGVIGQLHRRLRQVDNADVLTPTQSAVLGRLERDGAATQAELATAEHVRQQSMATTLSALDALGYLARTPDPADRRRTLISLSKLGAETVRGVHQHREEWLTHTLASELTAEELKIVTDALPLLRRLTTS
jgi:DNA-binding MarR family transcriptional regulator